MSQEAWRRGLDRSYFALPKSESVTKTRIHRFAVDKGAGEMATGPEALPDVDLWQPHQLQLIVFPMTPAVALPQNWWQQITGELPEDTRRRIQERTESGFHQDYVLTLNINILNISWTISPRIEPENQLEEVPTLGPFPVACASFLDLMLPWLENHCPPIKRLAFAGNLSQYVADRVSVVSQIS
jgi:hypothetical protein